MKYIIIFVVIMQSCALYNAENKYRQIKKFNKCVCCLSNKKIFYKNGFRL